MEGPRKTEPRSLGESPSLPQPADTEVEAVVFLVLCVVALLVVVIFGIRAEMREHLRQERFAQAIGELFGELLRQSESREPPRVP